MEEDDVWHIQAVWACKDGTHTVRQYCFNDFSAARKELVRLFCHFGEVGRDERVLRSLDVDGDFWREKFRPADTRTGMETRWE